MPWMLHVNKGSKNQRFVWLTEYETMENGTIISTGRHTGKYEGTAGGDYTRVETMLRESVAAMERESMLSFGREDLTVACVIGEHLVDLLLGDGGDDSVE